MKHLFFMCLLVFILTSFSCHTRNLPNDSTLNSTPVTCDAGDYALTLPSKDMICVLKYMDTISTKSQISRAICSSTPTCPAQNQPNEWPNYFDTIKKELPQFKKSNPVSAALSELELMALIQYSKRSYARIAQTIYNKTEIDIIEPLIKTIISGLNKLPKFKGTVYSGKTMTIDDFKKYFESGRKTYSIKTFLSATSQEDISYGFAMNPKEGVEYSVILAISSQNGRNISHISSFPEEREVLFYPAFPFKFEKIESKTGTFEGKSYNFKYVYLSEAL